ncbi:kelch domain-containing protein 1-like [Cyprinus carpio]|uniref:Kelch domain-containing protein 1-like n=1 Tax=Cyprinus carpio TaxID=7962 RepID=A0A9Q9Y0S9_CYPCA|nr:kelch domain-containing protein 1-like [Cyprinus carpio]
MSDGWIFNLETKGWTEMDKPRLWHSACQRRDSDVVVFGGSHDDILSVSLVCRTIYQTSVICEDLFCRATATTRSCSRRRQKLTERETAE